MFRMNMPLMIKDIGINGFLDMAFMAILVYTALVWFKRTRAGFVVTGIIIVAGVYLLARQFNLVMTASLFENFFAVILITLIVIFQEDLRRFFEQIAVWSLNRRFSKKPKIMLMTRPEVDILVRTVMDLAREKIGALIVLRGKDTIIRHLDGGENLGGVISEPLLKSIFDPHSIGHDGAVVIERSRITHFSCHLPLSKNLSKIKDRGTRHAAALGLSEVADALCLAVSEEKGTVSAARNGEIRAVNDPEKLTVMLQKFYEEVDPVQRVKPWEEVFKRNTKEKIYSIFLAAGLWFVLVHGSKIMYKSVVIPVSHVEPSDGWVVSEIDPREIEVTLKGPRRLFYFKIKDRVKLYLDVKMQKGAQKLKISPEDFIFPKQLILEEYDPHYVKVVLDKRTEKANQNAVDKKIKTEEIRKPAYQDEER